MFHLDPIHLINDAHAQVIYFQNLFSEEESAQLYSNVLAEVDFQPDTIQIFGKTITTQRLYAWHGDQAFDYAYSGKSRFAVPWTPILLKIKAAVEQVAKMEFNCCLLNYYADGSQGMSWHSDDEKVMQENGTIASVSLGAPRIFHFKHKTEDIRKKIILENGSLLLMQGQTQKQYLHQLPKSVKVKTGRINLTFRNFIQ